MIRSLQPKLLKLFSTTTTTTTNIKQPLKQTTLLTGLQPTGSLHLGNYFGSILNILQYQQDHNFSKKYLFIADLHSLTTSFTNQNSTYVYSNNIGSDSYQMIKTLLACGVNPQKTTIFIQSHIKQHSQLAWILSCFANQHALNFMVQYKEKGNQTSSVGLYTYPLLMASDILIYKSTHVPVGMDQVQHLELTNKLRERFNKIVRQQYFPHVKYVQAKKSKIMSLTNPQKKMSKSDPNQRSRIHLTDSPKKIQQKIRRAVTDSQGHNITYQPQKRKGLANLIDIYCILTNITQQQLIKITSQNKWSIGDFKNQLIKEISKMLGQIQKKKQVLDDKEVRRVIKEGAEKAREQAVKNIGDIKRLLKLF